MFFTSCFVCVISSLVYSFSFRVIRVSLLFFFLMIRRPPRSTLDRSSAASDVYKRQILKAAMYAPSAMNLQAWHFIVIDSKDVLLQTIKSVSYTHLRAHETVLDLVCRLLLEKKKKTQT